jgi:DNA-binding transcriptional LysR family regulator
MDIRELQTPMTAADMHCFDASAVIAPRTPSAVRRNIHVHAAEPGAKEFDRTQRPPRLTATNGEFFCASRQFLQVMMKARQSLDRGTGARGHRKRAIRTRSARLASHACATNTTVSQAIAVHPTVGLSQALHCDAAVWRVAVAVVAEQVTLPAALIPRKTA